MPTPCPNRLKELIRLANLDPESDARKHLQVIARACKAKRQRTLPAAASIQIQTSRTITIHLTDGTVEIPIDELELALDQLDPPSTIDLIRECPRCLEIFWAGRADKEACDRHTSAWSKREWRRKAKEKAVIRAKERAERNKKRAEGPFELTITSATILDAIFESVRSFKGIDDYCWARMSNHYIQTNIRPALNLLVAAGFLNCDEQIEGRWYTATEKLKKWRRELKGKTFWVLFHEIRKQQQS